MNVQRCILTRSNLMTDEKIGVQITLHQKSSVISSPRNLKLPFPKHGNFLQNKTKVRLTTGMESLFLYTFYQKRKVPGVHGKNWQLGKQFWNPLNSSLKCENASEVAMRSNFFRYLFGKSGSFSAKILKMCKDERVPMALWTNLNRFPSKCGMP